MPELLKMSMLTLGGIQPLTGAIAAAEEGLVSQFPTQGEIDYYRSNRTLFQFIFVVASHICTGFNEDHQPILKPYALSLVPATKARQALSENEIDKSINLYIENPYVSRFSVYIDFDPFAGDWSLFGDPEGLIGDLPRPGFMDEIGLVYDHYLLAKKFDKNDVLAVNFDMPNNRMFRKYLKHRTKLLFTPFNTYKARRIWGVDSPIELFLFQELELNGFSPQLQTLLFEDGSSHISLSDLWRSENMVSMDGMITEADFYFPNEKVAIFCDGAHHRRRKQRIRDQLIDEKLLLAGIQPVRIEGKEIVHDLAAASEKVYRALV